MRFLYQFRDLKDLERVKVVMIIMYVIISKIKIIVYVVYCIYNNCAHVCVCAYSLFQLQLTILKLKKQ